MITATVNKVQATSTKDHHITEKHIEELIIKTSKIIMASIKESNESTNNSLSETTSTLKQDIKNIIEKAEANGSDQMTDKLVKKIDDIINNKRRNKVPRERQLNKNITKLRNVIIPE